MNTTPKEFDAKPELAGNIAGKPVITIERKTALNLKSGFAEKLLCDGLTFTAGDACVYGCTFCYVPSQTRKMPGIEQAIKAAGKTSAEDVIIRRRNVVDLIRLELTREASRKEREHFHLAEGARLPRFAFEDTRTIYASPLVDVAATMEMAQETASICELILKLTSWRIRLLSKSSFLPIIAGRLEELAANFEPRKRVIYGVSTGTLDDELAKVFEQGTALVSKRLKSLHWLQDSGYRTFGMVCPSLPMQTTGEYEEFSRAIMAAIRVEKCEHVWAEVMNVRGESMTRTVNALTDAGFYREAAELSHVSTSSSAWELYSRKTFLAHKNHCPPEKLRFLQYVDKANLGFWEMQKDAGAVLLGHLVH